MNSRRSALRRQWSAVLLVVLLVSSSAFGWQQQRVAPAASAAALSAAERDLSESIKVETIKDVTTQLSADEMQGRGTMQPGGDKAAGYIAERFAKLGLKPLGEKNGYLQPIKFRETEFLPETSLKVGDATLKQGSDFVVAPPLSGDKSASGQMVFVAYGLVSATPKRNDFAGINVQGKIVVMLDGPPQSVSKEAWKKAKAQMTIMLDVVRGGAAGIIFVSHGREEHPYTEMADYLSRRQLDLADDEELPAFLPPFLMVSNETAEKLFAQSGTTFAQALEKAEKDGFTPFNLKQSAKITVRMKKTKGTGNNVVGLLEGSDAKLKNEAIVYTAHYDAFGVGAAGRIYHGAADNAIGVAEMIAMAEAFTQSPTKPRRSVIFLAVTGEEYGLYGSEYWAKNPTWKIKQVAANLNFDGMGTEVYGPVKTVVGYGAEHSSLGQLLSDVAAAFGIKVIPDPMPDEKSFYRSDHYAFVKKGVPALMLLGAPEGETSRWIDRMKKWEKTDYHQPTDVIRTDWDWNGPRAIAQVGVVMGMRLANTDAMPAWLQNSIFNRERGTSAPAPEEP